MIFPRTFRACSILFCVAGLASACGDDDETTATGGKGGKGGTAGKAGAGGTAGKGGTAGTAGKGGTAGTTGAGGTTGKGGTTGTAGSVGSGGTAGQVTDSGPDVTTGGTAGADASSDGAAGTDAATGDAAPDGTSGAGGSAGDAGLVPKQCIETCTTTADCLIDGGTAQRICRKGQCVVLSQDARCTVNTDCIPIASLWNALCSATQPCPNTTLACVDAGGGEGRCAQLASDAGTCGFGRTPISRPLLDDGGTVSVCGDTTQRCNPATNRCYAPCADDTDCGIPGIGDVCDTATGICGCGASAECTAASGAPTCNLTTKRCECASDSDCRRPDGGNFQAERDICVAGVCSCSGLSVCIKTFPGTTEACQ